MDSDVREVIRRRIALRERDGHERLLLNHEALRALLDAADERDRLAAAVERVRALHPRGTVEMITATDCVNEDCDDPEGHQWVDDPHGGGMLCGDEIAGTYCIGCAPDDATDMSDYPHPCATRRALDGADDV